MAHSGPGYAGLDRDTLPEPALARPTAHARTRRRAAVPLSAGSLYLESASDRPPLRVGLLLDGPVLPAFAARILDQLAACGFASVELLVFNAEGAEAAAQPSERRPLPIRAARVLRDRQKRKKLLFALYQKWDERRHGREASPYAPVDCTERLRGVPAITVAPLVKGFTHRFPDEALERVRGCGLDVILRFGFNILRGGILEAARYGVWSYHHGDNDRFRGGPPLFWEVEEDVPVSGVILQVLTEKLDAGLVLCKGLYPTERGISWSRNRYQPYWGAADFVIRKLHELHQHGWERVRARALPDRPYQGRRKLYRTPTNWEVCRFLLPRLARKAASRLVRPDRIGHWRVALRAGAAPLHEAAGDSRERPGMEGFRFLESPFGHFYADPFLLERRGRRWLFVEDYLYAEERGVISCAEVPPDGRVGAFERVLERPYHLSYPMVFAHDGEVFMIPESYASGAVELYRAAAFPRRWVLEKVLFRGGVVDTTVWIDESRVWFFVSVLEPRGCAVDLLLFSADGVTGEWAPHPANPISADVRNSRCAGAVFRSHGRLFRPSQDGSRAYGYSFSLNEVTCLTTESYAERRVLTVEPDWSRDLLASHTYAQCGPVEAVDGNFRALRRRHR